MERHNTEARALDRRINGIGTILISLILLPLCPAAWLSFGTFIVDVVTGRRFTRG